MHSIENYLSVKAILADTIVVTAVGAFGYLLKPKDRFAYLFGFCIFFTAICMINSVYYISYANFGSLAELSTLSQAETVTDSIYSQLRLVDFIYILKYNNNKV